MSSRPLTPPCVPFGTRRFNRISASYESARIGPESHSIRLVRAFRLLWNISESHFRLFSNSRDVCFPTGKPGILGYSISLGQHRIIPGGVACQKIFCEMIQKAQAILAGLASIFGKYHGKFWRDTPPEPQGANCAVVP